MPNTEDFYKKAIELDRKDPLARFKDQFFIEDDQLIYLDGNSLGRLPKQSKIILNEVIENQWGSRLINSWNENWMDLPDKLSAKIAKLIGAHKDEVFVGDTTSLNLYKLVYSALSINKHRTQIISDSFNFPTDLYVIQGLIDQQFKNHSLQLLESDDEIEMDEDKLAGLLSEQTALVSFSHVAFKSAFKYDMERINQIVHDNGALMIWDLSHSVGALPIKLNETNSDMAVGCTYKYLNGGPGAPAFLYVKRELQEKMVNPIWAWFSHDKPFSFSPDYMPNEGIGRFATATPSILSLAAIEPGLDITLEAGLDQIRAKSVLQSNLLLEMIKEFLIPHDFSIASPLQSNQRGSHISIQHSESYRISQAMINPKDDSKSIIPDFRPPNNIRLGIAPLYNSYLDVYETILRIQTIVQQKQYFAYDSKRKQVP